MNTIFEKAFGEAKENYTESVTESTRITEELFSKLPKLHKIFRMPYYSQRRYFTTHLGQPMLFTGLTTWSKKIISQKREDSFLAKWKEDMIKDGNDPEEYAWLASEFGTLVHIIAAHIFSARAKGESYSTIGLDRELLSYMNTIGVQGLHFKSWYDNLCKAIRSLNSFYSKTEMEVLGIEYCVIDFKNNICTPLDIICNITTESVEDVPNTSKEGTKRRKVKSRSLWNLNIKARKNGDRRSSDKYQICAEQYMFNNYLDGKFKVEKTGVISPSWNWLNSENADCKLHDFTGAFSEKDFNWYLNMYRTEPENPCGDMFDPDLRRYIGDANVFSVTEYGQVEEGIQRSIGDYILSYFEK